MSNTRHIKRTHSYMVTRWERAEKQGSLKELASRTREIDYNVYEAKVLTGKKNSDLLFMRPGAGDHRVIDHAIIRVDKELDKLIGSEAGRKALKKRVQKNEEKAKTIPEEAKAPTVSTKVLGGIYLDISEEAIELITKEVLARLQTKMFPNQ